MRAGTSLIAAAAALVWTLGATSAQPSASAAATLQFDKGRALMKEKKYAEACAAFEQSQKLDPQIGTLYNLGTCYTQLGKVASAWTAYREVGQRDANPDRKREANRRAKELEKRLPKLLLKPPAAPAPNLAVTMNGVDVTPLLGTESPVDPAEYQLRATATGFAPWEQVVTLEEGKTSTLAIELQRPGPKVVAPPPAPPKVVAPRAEPPRAEPPRAEPPRAEPPPPAPPQSDPPRPVADRVATSSAPRPDGPGPVAPPRSRRTTYAVIAGGAGLGVAVTGLVFGGLARSKWNDARSLCGADLMCDDPTTLERGNDLVDTARQRGRLATGFLIGGGALVGAGLVLWLTAPSSSPSSSTALRLTPALGPGHATITLGARF